MKEMKKSAPVPAAKIGRINVDFRTEEEVELLRQMKAVLALEGKSVREGVIGLVRHHFGHALVRTKH